MFTLTSPKTVDGVLSAFRKAVTDLQAVASFQSAEASKQEAVAAAALTAKAAAEAEAARAVTAATKLEAVFG